MACVGILSTGFVIASVLVLSAGGVGHGSAQDRAELQSRYQYEAGPLIAHLFPGARYDWEQRSLVWPDGRRDAFVLNGLTSTERKGGGKWLAAGTEFPEQLARELNAVKALSSPGRHTAKLVIARTDDLFVVVEARVIEIDPDSPVSALHGLIMGSTVPPGEWPDVQVWATSAAVFGDKAALIRWIGALGGTPTRWTVRLPTSVWYRERGKEPVEEELVSVPIADGQQRLVGARSGSVVVEQCPALCNAAAFEVLAAMLARRPKAKAGQHQ
jgi:hypothetical protein